MWRWGRPSQESGLTRIPAAERLGTGVEGVAEVGCLLIADELGTRCTQFACTHLFVRPTRRPVETGGECGFAAVGCDRWLQQSQGPIVRDSDQGRGYGRGLWLWGVWAWTWNNSPRSYCLLSCWMIAELNVSVQSTRICLPCLPLKMKRAGLEYWHRMDWTKRNRLSKRRRRRRRKDSRVGDSARKKGIVVLLPAG